MTTDNLIEHSSGTLWFHKDTPKAVQDALLQAHYNRDTNRVRLWYGDVKTGRAWQEEHDVTGYIGRSTGSMKVPLLIPTKSSVGGGHLLDHCIVRIDWTDGSCTLNRHPKFHTGLEKGRVGRMPIRTPWEWQVLDNNGTSVAGFKTERQAKRWLDFMNGRRYSK